MKTDASVNDLRYARTMLGLRQANSTYAWLRKIGCPDFICTSYLLLRNRWLNSSDGERVGMGLVAVNAVVFLA